MEGSGAMRSIDNMREWWRDRFPVMDRQLGCDFREHINAIEFEVKALTDERDMLKRQWEAGVDFDQRLEACADKREDVTLWGVDYTPLPLDADGVPIHVGDVMDSKVDYLFDGRPFEVRAIVLCEDGWEAADGRFGNRYEPNSLRHHHAPTVEDVLAEMLDVWGELPSNVTNEAIIAEYAARLRLAGEDE